MIIPETVLLGITTSLVAIIFSVVIFELRRLRNQNQKIKVNITEVQVDIAIIKTSLQFLSKNFEGSQENETLKRR